ncbi:Uncharacterized protein ToN1_05120 [Aromatoleum petrolei]|nr:Uncharacterized protein ToN1_05120 [Aromatoleum petrolei]
MVKTAAENPEHFTQNPNWPHRPVFGNEAELHVGSFAK